MLKISIIVIGTLKEKYDQQAQVEFLKRLSSFCKLELIELDESRTPTNPSEKQIEAAKLDETERQLAKIPHQSKVIVLDSRGEQLSSTEFSTKLTDYTTQGTSHLTFLIGGSHGFSSVIDKTTHWKWSFSKLTFTHQMIRIMLLEQLYRAFKIANNEPYHK